MYANEHPEFMSHQKKEKYHLSLSENFIFSIHKDFCYHNNDALIFLSATNKWHTYDTPTCSSLPRGK